MEVCQSVAGDQRFDEEAPCGQPGASPGPITGQLVADGAARTIAYQDESNRRQHDLRPPMSKGVQFVGPKHALQLFGVKLVGVNAENGKELLFSATLVLLLMAVNAGLRRLARRATSRADQRAGFWMRQGTSLAMSVIW